MSEQRRAVFVAGCGLVSALGPTLAAALARLAADEGPAMQWRELAPGESWPYCGLAAPAAGDWQARARQVIGSVMAEAGALADRRGPLFIASSSTSVGAVEQGCEPPGDTLSFSERVAGWLAWRGPVLWVNTACTSAINAVRSAQRLLESGVAERATVLALELDNRYTAGGFAAMQLLSAAGSRPLAAERDGLVLGEAVAALHLVAGGAEPLSGGGDESPRRWRLRGGANRVDGRDPAGASVAAVSAMAREALGEAGLAPEAVDLIKLQAAGSPHNDAAEIAGLRAVFAHLPALVSLKPLLGHTLGAAGAAELVLLLAALEAGHWPRPPAGSPDPALAAGLAGGAPDRVRYLLAIILGFGGGHAALLLEDTAAEGR